MEVSRQDVEDRLIDLLYTVWNDDEFVTGVFSSVESVEEELLLIKFIERGIDVDPTQVGLLALDIANARERGETFTDADI